MVFLLVADLLFLFSDISVPDRSTVSSSWRSCFNLNCCFYFSIFLLLSNLLLPVQVVPASVSMLFPLSVVRVRPVPLPDIPNHVRLAISPSFLVQFYSKSSCFLLTGTILQSEYFLVPFYSFFSMLVLLSIQSS